MSFKYQPDRLTPDPWPVDGPQELTDNEYASALANVDSPYISNILAELGQGSGNVIVWLLFLGQSYDPKAENGRIQGYYIRGVVRSRQALRRDLEPLGGVTGALRGERGQLTLSNRMIAPDPDEVRERVVGWGFADQ